MHLEGSIQILLSAHSLSYVAKEIKGRNPWKDKILITEQREISSPLVRTRHHGRHHHLPAKKGSGIIPYKVLCRCNVSIARVKREEEAEWQRGGVGCRQGVSLDNGGRLYRDQGFIEVPYAFIEVPYPAGFVSKVRWDQVNCVFGPFFPMGNERKRGK